MIGRGWAWRAGTAVVLTIVYVLTFIAVYPIFGAGSAALEAVPVAVVGWLGGPWWGAIAGIAAFGLNVVLLNAVGYGSGPAVVVQGGGLIPSIAVVFVGMVVGWLAKQAEQIRAQARALETERLRLEQEVSRRHRVEAQLRTSEERLRAVVASAPVVLISIDARGTITSCEGQVQRLFGTSAERIVGTTIGTAFLSHPAVLRLARDAIAGRAGSGEFPIFHRELAVQFVPVRNESDELIGASGVMVDRAVKVASA